MVKDEDRSEKNTSKGLDRDWTIKLGHELKWYVVVRAPFKAQTF